MAIADTRKQHGPIRAFVPHRDLDDLATLIEVAFSRELELTGSTIVTDLRQMASWSPLLMQSANLLSPFIGFVWIDEDRVVGNVSLNRDSVRRIWTMSNVAVLPEYRGRGIGGRLVDVAIEYVIRANGSAITLQVRHDNELAREMYGRRGFMLKRSWHELQLPPTDKFEARRNTFNVHHTWLWDRKAVKRLYEQGSPSQLGAPFSFGTRIAFMLEGQQLVERSVRHNGQTMGYGIVRLRTGHGPNQAEIRVLPEARGLVEHELLYSLFASAQQVQKRAINMLISSSHREAFEVACVLGMRPLRILDEMALVLNESEKVII